MYSHYITVNVCFLSEKACRQPQPIENGEILSVENGTLRREQLGAVIYMNGAKLKFTCHAGFLLRGTSEITCNKGIWTSAPTCIGNLTA